MPVLPVWLSWVLAAALIGAAAVAVGLQRRVGALRAEARRRERFAAAEARHLAEVRLPALAGRQAAVPGPRDAEAARLAGHERVLAAVEGGLAAVRAESDAAAAGLLRAAVLTVRPLAAGQQTRISDMQHTRGADPDVLADLMELDHANALLQRRVQALGVLSGAGAGRPRGDAPVVDAVRGAVSRVRDFRRVKIGNSVENAAAGQARLQGRFVEPVAAALAELLDNAARCSDPSSLVAVDILHGVAGVLLTVDDAGPGLGAEQWERAQALVSGRAVPPVTGLGAPPAFGFAVIGALVREHPELRVTLEHGSPFGGVRAQLLVGAGALAAPC